MRQPVLRHCAFILSAVMPQHAFGFLYPAFAISGIQAAPPSPPPSPPLPPRAPHLPPSPPPPSASCEMVRMPIDGFCRAGYYAGAESGRLLRGTTAAEETRSYATEETCLSMCLNEERCRYAALKGGVSCSRYGAEAGNCTNDQQCATVNGACPCGAWATDSIESRQHRAPHVVHRLAPKSGTFASQVATYLLSTLVPKSAECARLIGCRPPPPISCLESCLVRCAVN